MRKLIGIGMVALIVAAGIVGYASSNAHASEPYVTDVSTVTANGQDGGAVTYVVYQFSDGTSCTVNHTGVNRTGKNYC